MSRARNIKPGFFTNGDLLECTPLARLLFAGLWCEADRRGILEDRPKTIKVKVLPGDNCDVDELLNELQDHGFIDRYESGEFRCIFVKNFDKHQNPHVKEQANTLPAPDGHHASPVLAPVKSGLNPAESLLLNPDSGILKPDPVSTPLPPKSEPDRWDQKIALFEAYCRGVGIKPNSAEMERRRHLGYVDVEAVIGLITPEKLEDLARWVVNDWRNAGIPKTPAIGKVLEQESEFDRAQSGESIVVPIRGSPRNRTRTDESRSALEAVQAIARGER